MKKKEKVGPMYRLNKVSGSASRCKTVVRHKPKRANLCGCTLSYVCYLHMVGSSHD